jgi:hypothetical protein
MRYPKVNCPKCGRLLPASRDVTCGGRSFPFYTCPECVTRTTFMGAPAELSLTFLVGPDGRPTDPARPGGEIDMTPYE